MTTKRGKKISGGKYHKRRKRKLAEKPGQEQLCQLGETKKKTIRVRGGNKKVILLSTNLANLIVKGKAKKVKIKTVAETPSNRFLARQNVLIKGAIIETEAGRAKITNRPSQEGSVQAILVD